MTSKKATALALCVLLTFAALCVWDAAYIIGDALHVSHIWFDMLTAVLIMAAIGCSCIGNGEGEDRR